MPIRCRAVMLTTIGLLFQSPDMLVLFSRIMMPSTYVEIGRSMSMTPFSYLKLEHAQPVHQQ